LKIRVIFILAFSCFALSQCADNEGDKHYSNQEIVIDIAQTALYYHTIFREAENAWALVDSKDYESFTEEEENATGNKQYVYDESEKSVTITYNSWTTNNLLFSGDIEVKFDSLSYRIQTKAADVFLTDFYINNQNVKGDFRMLYTSGENDENDKYTYTLFNGAAINEAGRGRRTAVLTTAAISGAQYERIEGGETHTQDDDIWEYKSGNMTGMLRGDSKYRYTNKIVEPVYYVMNCLTAGAGISQIEITGRPVIFYGYYCDEVYFESQEIKYFD
jgi:hypothetical protein